MSQSIYQDTTTCECGEELDPLERCSCNSKNNGKDASELIQLLPCPFCGGEASSKGKINYSEIHEAEWADGSQVRKAHYVNCIYCGSSNKGIIGHQTEEKAVEHWNKRAG